jgi:hypothetical protein
VTVWEITNDWVEDYADLVLTAQDLANPNFEKQFGGDGSPLRWKKRPKLTVFIERGNKKPQPRSDITTIALPGPILSQNARDVLGDFLGQFGQLLELDVDGHVEYYYNVTNVVSCLDQERTERTHYGAVTRPVFSTSSMPDAPIVFKVPRISSRIFVNGGAKDVLEERIARHHLVGMSFEVRETS